MQNSKIEWCDHTANAWEGCVEVHAGCDHCYARVMSHRWGKDLWGNDKPRMIVKSFFTKLDLFQKLAAKAGEVHRVFINSISDLFERPMPLIDGKGETLNVNTGDIRNAFFMQIELGKYPNLLFLLLTKRPSNINKYIPESWKENPPANVMFGTSPVDHATAYTLVNQLIQVKGKRFLSVEPQLGPISLLHWLPQIDWVIQGGESGHGKRPFNLEWAYDMQVQCDATNTPYFFKQIDKVQPIPEHMLVREFPAL